jgi:hypothetical protein
MQRGGRARAGWRAGEDAEEEVEAWVGAEGVNASIPDSLGSERIEAGIEQIDEGVGGGTVVRPRASFADERRAEEEGGGGGGVGHGR